MRRAGNAGLGVAVGACALVLGGCVGFDGKPRGKQVSEDKVRVKFEVCAAGEPGCSDQGPSGSGSYRLLVGLRAPEGTDAPAEIRPVGRPERLQIDRPYQRQLNELAPAPGDARWIGYSSKAFDYAAARAQSDAPRRVPRGTGEPSSARFRITLGLPREIGRKFRWRPVVGFMGVSEAEPEDARVRCGDDPYNQTGNANATCIDTPETAAETRESFRIRLSR
jgi:hypothetical protein